MVTRILRGPECVEKLSNLLNARKFPMTVTITVGELRRGKANRLAQRWFTDISRQLGDQTHEDVRAFCKLTIGVPILRAENEAFRASYDKTMRPLDYETKIEAMKSLDIPVTRMMTVKQMTGFMDEVSQFWTKRGIRLTDPKAMKYEDEFT